VPTFAPHRALTTRVIAIDVLHHTSADAFVLPSTSAVLGFQFRGRVRQVGGERLSPAGVTGLLGGPRRFAYEGAAGSVLVRFTPQGAACLGLPVGELADRSVALADFGPPGWRIADLGERLHEARDDAARATLVQDWLLALPYARDPLVTRALARLGAAEGDAAIAAIARELGLSERQLERRFLVRVGVTPRRYARLVRFERAAARLASAAEDTLASIGQEAGYFDQSHFIREVRAFAGTTPAALRRR
jgi:AraC-like DNA-binding protein